MDVEYRYLPEFPGYRVGSDGSVWSRRLAKMIGGRSGAVPCLSDEWHRLQPVLAPDGYLRACLYRNGQPKVWRRVHRLVLMAFRGPCPVGMEACHCPDRTPTNNRLDNLRWDTKQRNEYDKRKHGKCNGSTKLTEAKAIEIRRRLAAGEKQQMLAREFGVSQTAICKINRKKSWTHAMTS